MISADLTTPSGELNTITQKVKVIPNGFGPGNTFKNPFDIKQEAQNVEQFVKNWKSNKINLLLIEDAIGIIN